MVSQHFIDGPFDGFQVAVPAARLRNVRAVKESDDVGASITGDRLRNATKAKREQGDTGDR